jgi:Gas vesicle synthesis protein GvpO
MADGDKAQDGGQTKRLGVRELARRAGGELEELLGKPVASVLGVQKRDDDDYEVTVEVVEVDRIPETTNIMGVYKVVLDRQGQLLEYARTRRYHRSQANEDG